MTVENWIAVATIFAIMMTAIATILGPVLAALIQSRSNQPALTPTTSQPKKAGFIAWFRRHSLIFNLIEALVFQLFFIGQVFVINHPPGRGMTMLLAVVAAKLITSGLNVRLKVLERRLADET